MKKLSFVLLALVAVIAFSCSNPMQEFTGIFNDATAEMEKAESEEAAKKIYDETKTKIADFVKENKEATGGSESDEKEMEEALNKFCKVAAEKTGVSEEGIQMEIGLMILSAASDK